MYHSRTRTLKIQSGQTNFRLVILTESPSKNQFHVYHIEPAAELETDLPEMADFLKTKPVVQYDAGDLVRINTRNYGVMPERPGADDQFFQQKGTDATPMMLVMHID